MCKILSEGGPCYSHLNQKIQSLREDMKFDARQEAASRGIPADLGALQLEQEQIAQSANQIIDLHNSNLAKLHAEATVVSNRGKKSKEDYRPDDVDKARKLFAFRMGHPDDENFDEGFRKIAMSESLSVRAKTLEHELSTQQDSYAAKLSSENPSEKTLELQCKKIHNLQVEKELCEGRKAELEKAAQKDFKGDKKALTVSRKISQQILSSAEYLNAQEQFSNLKESIQKEQKEAAAIKRARDKELKRSNSFPPITGAEYEVFLEHEYPQTDSSRNLQRQLEAHQSEIRQTPTALSELRKRGNELGGYSTSTGRELLMEANRYSEEKIRRVSAAQGKNRADTNYAVGSDPHITAEREYRASTRQSEMLDARKKYEREILEKKKQESIARRKKAEALLNPKPQAAKTDLSRVSVRGLTPKPGLRKFSVDFGNVTVAQTQRLEQLKAKNDIVIARKFKTAENKILAVTSVSLQANSRYVVRSKNTPLAPKNFEQAFANKKPNATVSSSSRALAMMKEQRKAQSLPIAVPVDAEVVRRPLPPKPSKAPVMRATPDMPLARSVTHKAPAYLPPLAARAIPPKPTKPPRSASSLALDKLRAQKTPIRPLPQTREVVSNAASRQNETFILPPRPARRFPRPARLKSEQIFATPPADPEPRLPPAVARVSTPLTREMPVLRLKPRPHGKFDEVIRSKKISPRQILPVPVPNPNQKRREQIFSRFRPSLKSF